MDELIFRIRESLDHNSFPEAEKLCKKLLSGRPLQPDEASEVRGLLTWALVLRSKPDDAIKLIRAYSEGGGKTIRSCVRLAFYKTTPEAVKKAWLASSEEFWLEQTKLEPDNVELREALQFVKDEARRLFLEEHTSRLVEASKTEGHEVAS